MTSSNVVPIPSAALRIVRQPTGKAAREYRAEFRSANPWPGEHHRPGEREAARQQADRQALLADLGQSAEMAVIAALLRTMSLAQIEAVGVALDLFPGTTEATALLQARAIIEAAAESRRAMEAISNLYGRDKP